MSGKQKEPQLDPLRRRFWPLGCISGQLQDSEQAEKGPTSKVNLVKSFWGGHYPSLSKTGMFQHQLTRPCTWDQAITEAGLDTVGQAGTWQR